MKTVYYNATVYTGSMPTVQAFVVEDGQFTFAGSNEDALALLQPGDCKQDLAGGFVCPGFIDSHMHLLNFGQALSVAPLHLYTRSLDEMLQCLKAHRQSALRGNWLLGRGWNQDLFADVSRMPNRYDLDSVATDIPICVVRACGHALVLNSYALNLLGITAETPQPEGGQIVLENREPNGVLFDNAMDVVYAAIPAPSMGELKAMLRTACAVLNTYGVTSCHSDDYCVFANIPWQQINQAYKELEDAGELTVRVYEQCNFTNLEDLSAFTQAGIRTGHGTDRFRIGPLKMLGDGALGARTAYLTNPYADDPTTRGLSVFSQDAFDEMIGFANANGMQVAVHTIGDACLDMVLNSIRKALDTHPRPDHRHGIVHCQITRADQLKALAELGLHIYAQSIFLDYDIRIVEARVGKELAQTSYSWNTLMKSGCTVSNGTDCPVELPNALGGIQCAVTRKTLAGFGPYLSNEAFTVQQAIDSYTAAGAYASFEETRKGKIEAGMLADFVVLGSDPFTVAPEHIKDIPVLATYVAGLPVYTAVQNN